MTPAIYLNRNRPRSLQGGGENPLSVPVSPRIAVLRGSPRPLSVASAHTHMSGLSLGPLEGVHRLSPEKFVENPKPEQLNHLFGPLRGPRCKSGRNAIQKFERYIDPVTGIEDPFRAKRHPGVTVIPYGYRKGMDATLDKKLKEIFDEIKGVNGKPVPYKFTVDENGNICLANPKIPAPEGTIDPKDPAQKKILAHIKLGHVTLFADEDIPPKYPRGRIGGVLSSEPSPDAEDDENNALWDIYADNDSGRYGQYPELTPLHLDNLRDALIMATGETVKLKWLNMELEGVEQLGPPSLP